MHKNPSKIFKSPSVFKEKITFPINKLMFYLIKLTKLWILDQLQFRKEVSYSTNVHSVLFIEGLRYISVTPFSSPFGEYQINLLFTFL